MKVFVTGAAGFLGSHLADAMIADGYNVVGVDNLSGGDRLNVPDGCDFHEVDCRDFAAMQRLMRGASVVFHCAALAHDGLSVFSPAVIVESIVNASTTVFSAAIANGVKRIVNCSSMARYGASPAPFREYQRPAPENPYAIAKVAAEQLLTNLCETHGTEFAIAVPHNIIGPRQKYDDPFRNVAAIMINLMLQGRQPTIYGDGSQRRCFSFVSDCVSCLKAMAFKSSACGEVINIGPDEGDVTVIELAETIADLIGFDLDPTFAPARPREVRDATCSSDKARQLLGYETKTDLKTGLALMIEAIRARGARPFVYHLPLEIVTPRTPATWTQRLFPDGTEEAVLHRRRA